MPLRLAVPLHYIRRLTGRSRLPSADRQLGCILAAIAGATDAIGFRIAREYTSHMTGAASALGERLAEGERAAAMGALGILGAFLAGATCCTVMVHHARRRAMEAEFAPPLLVEAAFLLVIAVSGSSHLQASFAATWVMTCALAFTMGLQNALITKISRGEIRTTHVTGIVTDLGIEWGRKLAALSGAMRVAPANPGDSDRVRLLALLLASFILGCVGGTLAAERVGRLALLAASSAIAVMAILPLAGASGQAVGDTPEPASPSRAFDDSELH